MFSSFSVVGKYSFVLGRLNNFQRKSRRIIIVPYSYTHKKKKKWWEKNETSTVDFVICPSFRHYALVLSLLYYGGHRYFFLMRMPPSDRLLFSGLLFLLFPFFLIVSLLYHISITQYLFNPSQIHQYWKSFCCWLVKLWFLQIHEHFWPIKKTCMSQPSMSIILGGRKGQNRKLFAV